MAYKMNDSVGQLGNLKQPKPVYDNSASTQRKRILSYLKKNHRISTIEAREKLGILHPCGRIKELRAQGYWIETHWTNELDSNGVVHRVGLYIYRGRKEVGHGR